MSGQTANTTVEPGQGSWRSARQALTRHRGDGSRGPQPAAEAEGSAGSVRRPQEPAAPGRRRCVLPGRTGRLRHPGGAAPGAAIRHVRSPAARRRQPARLRLRCCVQQAVQGASQRASPGRGTQRAQDRRRRHEHAAADLGRHPVQPAVPTVGRAARHHHHCALLIERRMARAWFARQRCNGS